MTLIEFIKKNNSSIQKNYDHMYEKELKEHIEYLKSKEDKKNWWEVEEYEDSPEFELSLLERYSILIDLIDELFKDYINNKNLILKLFHDIEVYLQQCSQEEKDEIEVFFIESLVNVMLNNDKYEILYSHFHPLTKQICDKNNDFWKTLSNK